MRKKRGSYTFLDLAKSVLELENRPLTTAQIWNIGNRNGLTDKVGSLGKTPINTLQARLYIDIRDNEKTIFQQVSKRPSKFMLKNDHIDEQLLEEEISDLQEESSYNERDLHILLSSFVYANPDFHCVTKTIHHEKTSKIQKGYNQWLHPDLVGIHFPFEEYSECTMDLQKMLNNEQYEIYSFEMKKKVTLTNLREYFFQAVSNSSWANEGYLVALEYDEDESFMSELKRLNNAFGIGIIQLNAQNISQSAVLFSAKRKDFLDWDTIDRLVENSDFKEFIKEIKDDAVAKRIRGKYDLFYKDDVDAAKYARTKNIIKK
ncbi:HTH domain-containing protein [Anaerobutyricum hallii]|uniref:HrgA protein n=1 Tax=Anaerobutyricum hallii TaxID=39488 RepID=A0A415UEK8_9FIRM|nr:HTH domain-containing protein [Anaerobutyricum hallii]RHN16523.1 HrgA protein [Anaerobutyricum hallii]